ncbi:PQQ-binding-like beta-propeller repeat protein [bacterium]|nr:PQQ-binding-like beta-propeller repeat protein [bacterium]
MKIATLLSVCILVAAMACRAADAPDWPSWRGPDKDGISKETGWNPASLKKAPKIDWKAGVGFGFSSVTIKSNALYTMGWKDGKDVVSCLDPATGKTLWTYSYACERKTEGFGDFYGPRATPVVSDGRVYTLSQFGHLNCLDAKTGAPVWSTNVVDAFGAGIPTWGIAGSPYVHGNALLVNTGERGAVLDKNTGKAVWSSAGVGGYATPVVFTRKGRTVAAMFGKDAIRLVDARSGNELWSFKWKTNYDVNAADPLIKDTLMFISSGYGRGCALFDLSADEPRKLYELKTMNNQFSTSILIGDCLYGVDGNTGGGKLECIDLRSGARKWAQGGNFDSVIGAGGMLIATTGNGDLVIVKADPGAYAELGRASLGTNKTKWWTHPVLCRGKIYCRNGAGDLFCLDVSK